MLRALGVPQNELREKHGFIWVVHEMNIKFVKAARLDDELRVTAQFTDVRGLRTGIRQEMTRQDNGELVCTADVVAVMLHADSLKPARVPDWIKTKLEMD